MKKTSTSFVIRIFLIATLVLVILTLVIKKGNEVYWINGNHNSFLDIFFFVFTNLGDGIVFLPLIIYFLFVQFRLSILALAVWICQGILSTVIKRNIFGHMRRPKELLDRDLLYFVPNIEVFGKYSFPSGHTTTIFCLTLLLALFLRNRTATIILLIVALLVGYSRIYLLQHFLMDVAGGAVIGTTLTFLLWKLFERNMPSWMYNSLKINPNFSIGISRFDASKRD